MDRFTNIGVKVQNKKRMYVDIRYPEVPLLPNDLYLTSTVGDRLDILADEYYSDKELWWVIAAANPEVIKGDSWYLPPGITFRIPASAESIVNDFNRLNQGSAGGS